MNKIDILAIGDIATDVFIKITEAKTKCDIHGDHCELCLNYGGKIPYENAKVCHAVGNSSNFAIGASRLGIVSALMTNMGDDKNGADCLDVLKKEKVDTDFIKIESGKPSNYHYVLWYNKERTILTKHEKYDYELININKLEKDNTPSWIYLSSLGENSLHFHDEILNYLNNNIKIKLAFQPGTFQIRLGTEKLKDIYKRTDILFCNHDEAEKILGIEEQDINILIKEMYILGPKIVVITDGVNGSYSYDGNEIIFMKAYTSTPESFIETTGAGDAFSSAFMTAFYLGKDIKTSLKWGSINAASVISYIGPHDGLLNKEEIEKRAI